jgi:hypothetical protein
VALTSVEGVAITVSTLDGLLDAPRPAGWMPVEFVLKAIGRMPLAGPDREALGLAAARFPLIA